MRLLLYGESRGIIAAWNSTTSRLFEQPALLVMSWRVATGQYVAGLKTFMCSTFVEIEFATVVVITFQDRKSVV